MKEFLRRRLVQSSAISRFEIVEEVLTVVQTFEHQNPVLRILEVIVDMNDTLNFVHGLVQQDLSRVFLLADHQPVLRLLLWNKFHHHGLVVAQAHTFVNVREASAANETAQLVVITEVRLDGVEPGHVE